MDSAQAQARLERMVAASDDPILDSPTITDLLGIAARCDAVGNSPRNTVDAPIRTASTLYAVNDLVRQNSTTERWWTCEVPGTTSASSLPAPSGWPILDYFRISDFTVYDGTVLWRDAGTRWQPTYDLNAAAAMGWEIKAASVASRFTFSADGQTYNRSEIHAACLMQADRYRRRKSGTVTITTM